MKVPFFSGISVLAEAIAPVSGISVIMPFSDCCAVSFRGELSDSSLPPSLELCSA